MSITSPERTPLHQQIYSAMKGFLPHELIHLIEQYDSVRNAPQIIQLIEDLGWIFKQLNNPLVPTLKDEQGRELLNSMTVVETFLELPCYPGTFSGVAHPMLMNGKALMRTEQYIGREIHHGILFSIKHRGLPRQYIPPRGSLYVFCPAFPLFSLASDKLLPLNQPPTAPIYYFSHTELCSSCSSTTFRFGTRLDCQQFFPSTFEELTNRDSLEAPIPQSSIPEMCLQLPRPLTNGDLPCNFFKAHLKWLSILSQNIQEHLACEEITWSDGHDRRGEETMYFPHDEWVKKQIHFLNRHASIWGKHFLQFDRESYFSPPILSELFDSVIPPNTSVIPSNTADANREVPPLQDDPLKVRSTVPEKPKKKGCIIQ